MYNIETLAKMAGLSRRTVRYYVQRGLLEPPEGMKRGSYYTEKHLLRLHEIQKLSEQGVPLLKIKEVLEGHVDIVKTDIKGPVRPTATRWEKIDFGQGVELHFKPNSLNPFEAERIINFIEGIVDKHGRL